MYMYLILNAQQNCPFSTVYTVRVGISVLSYLSSATAEQSEAISISKEVLPSSYSILDPNLLVVTCTSKQSSC